jgi:hypothetical protein
VTSRRVRRRPSESSTHLDRLSTAHFGAQTFVERTRIVGRKNTCQQLVRWRPLSAMVPERTLRDVIAPYVGEQKRAREGAANATRVISKVEVP